MQQGLLVEFSCNPHSLLDSPLESFTACEDHLSLSDEWLLQHIALIVLSGGFSIEILTGVQLYYRRLSWIGVFLLWKIEYLDFCTTTMRVCCKEGGYYER